MTDRSSDDAERLIYWDSVVLHMELDDLNGTMDEQIRAERAMTDRRVLSTVEELDALPVGSVVMCLWDVPPLHHVMQKYSTGWYGFPSDHPLFPLGSGKHGETVALLWGGGDD